MDSNGNKVIKKEGPQLFDRVVSILEQARKNVVRSVNSNMVIAHWLIGREIVEELQAGDERAEYGKRILAQLSEQLIAKIGTGFSVPNLRNFRQFYSIYPDRSIHYPSGSELQDDPKHYPEGSESHVPAKRRPAGDSFKRGFHPQLSWSHYRALMRVSHPEVRDFYEQEAAECGWTKSQLERQIHTSYYERILRTKGKEGLLPANRERLPGNAVSSVQMLKSPYVLEFLDLPDSPALHESELEQAIISNLQLFLLELGKGFSFVARQKHIRFDDDDFYVDLVFYNFVLKCFVLIDLKIGKLTHADVGQMDGYVRLFEDRFKVKGDNPTIGLILCSDKGEAVARYSVLKESKQIFASKYLKFLPSEEELRKEIEKERKLIEAVLEDRDDEE